MLETWRLYADANDAIGPKKVAAALNLSLAQVYKLAQPLEAEGVRNDMDRIETLIDVLAAHPDAKPVLHRMRLHFDGVFKRAIDRDAPAPMSDEQLAMKAGSICEEVGDLLRVLKPGTDNATVAKEASEVIVAVEKLMKSLNQKPCNVLRPPLRAS